MCSSTLVRFADTRSGVLGALYQSSLKMAAFRSSIYADMRSNHFSIGNLKPAGAGADGADADSAAVGADDTNAAVAPIHEQLRSVQEKLQTI